MHTLTIQITNSNALKTLHNLAEKQYIKVVEDSKVESPALAGEPMSLKGFRDWIADAERAGSVDLKEAKSKWAQKRKQLEKRTR